MSGVDPEHSRRRPVIAVWPGGVDGGDPLELLEVNVPYPYGAMVDWLVDRINGLEGRVEELEREVARLKEEVKGKS
ncbi:MAG: bZIP transcription factor [Nitrososphaeria archaeon]